MSHQEVTYDTFTIDRVFDAPPERVFEALANPELKAKWFRGPSAKENVRTQDFRVGGRDKLSGTFPSGMTSVFDAQYFDIVPNERVVYVYEMTVDGRKISTSLATFELFAAGGGKTKLVLTEQGAYYDDPNSKTYAPRGQAAGRLEGTNVLMNQLGAMFTR